jgi:hypothetical protein
METISKKYIVDDENNKIAVQLDMETYRKLENIIENYALVQLMNEEDVERMEIHETK